MEAYGQLNLLKTGLVFADAITAVSPTYAREIQTPQFGCGLEGVLAGRANALVGILNGIDESAWNPAADPHLAANYGPGDWQSGKAACKAALQRELGLPDSARTPLVGLIGRLTEQKGWDLVIELLVRWAGEADVQWAVLGSGDERYRAELDRLAAAHPSRVAARFAFSEPLAHRIEAGADIFVMASRFEPCGLNQMYSQRYGTVPVVRRTGGLADTVTSADALALDAGEATGFVFDEFTADALEGALTRATETFRYRPGDWAQLVETGMRRDWSWEKSARSYAELYEQLIRPK
jgi:starch synthase